MFTSPQRRLLRESDKAMREIERQSISGDQDAQVKELIQRMRAGKLTKGQVKLLSYLGHPPARQLMPEVEAPNDLKKWSQGLGPMAIRAAIIATWGVLPVWENWCDENSEHYEAPRAAIIRSESNTNFPGNINSTTSINIAEKAKNAATMAMRATFNCSYAAYKATNAAYKAADAAASLSYATVVDPGDDSSIRSAGWVISYAYTANSNIRSIIEKELIKWVLNDN